MTRRSASRLTFASIEIEGSLLLPDVVAKIADGAAPEQAPGDYEIPEGLNIRNELARYWSIGRAAWIKFEAGKIAAPAASRAQLARTILGQVLGFALPEPGSARSPVTATMVKHNSVPLFVVADENVDAVVSMTSSAGKDIRRSGPSRLQMELNADQDALWGIVTNGTTLRILRDNDSLTRPARIDVDLDKVFRDGLVDEFNVFWQLCHHTRFGRGDGNPSDCPLEIWRTQGHTDGITARDKLRDGVERALHQFGTGFLEASPELRRRVASTGSDDLSPIELQRQLLRFVYRLIFLMTAEDRNVLLDPRADDSAKRVFSAGYTTDKLRERSRFRAQWDRHHDAYDGLRVLIRAAAKGEPLLGVPALGGIFAEDQCPDLDSGDARILNRRFLEGIFNLSWMQHDKSLVRVNWRDMETEELGSVYESLLELTPAVTGDGKTFFFVNGVGEPSAGRQGVVVKGNNRKTTGSYYTPDSLVQLLLDKTLDPIIDKTVAENPTNPEALLKLNVIDPAAGSGHFLLGAARRVANRLAELRKGGAQTEADYREAMRDVISHCIYGVDLNDFAIELCKVALWLESVEPGKPLEFLDNHIVRGNALAGVFGPEMLRLGIPDEAYAVLAGDDKDVARTLRDWNKKERRAAQTGASGLFESFAIPPQLVEAADAVIQMPSNTLDDIAAQKTAYAELVSSDKWRRFKAAADAYVGAYYSPKKQVSLPEASMRTSDAALVRALGVPTSEIVWDAIRKGSESVAVRSAVDVSPLHWFLIFPHIFKNGGFDVVVGNPPWERIKLQEQEFFAARSPEIASAPNKAARAKLIAGLKDAAPGSADRKLYDEFSVALREAEASSEFVRTPADAGGRYALTGTGDVNTYALFAELFTRLTRPGGRCGLIVPTGIATDATTAPFFASLVQDRRLVSLVDFENRGGLFPAVDSRMKFAAMTVGDNAPEAEFSFFLTDPTQTNDEERRFTLSPEQIAIINPNTKTAPVFRSRSDAELTSRMYSTLPVLLDERKGKEGNPWGLALYARFFHLTEDISLFRRGAELSAAGALRDGSYWVQQDTSDAVKRGRWLPVHEGELGFQFDHRFGSFDGSAVRPVTEVEHADTSFEATPTYWVHESDFTERWSRRSTQSQTFMLGARRVSSSTNERTAVSSVLPFWPVTYGWILFIGPKAEAAALLCANVNALVFDYLLRNKLSQPSIPQGVLAQIAALPPAAYSSSDVEFVTLRALKLTYTSHSMAPFAQDLGYSEKPFKWDESQRAKLRAELDAFYARKYGLTRDELRYILDPTDAKGKDYPSETFRVLKEKERSMYGEYRTAKLVLAAYDEQTKTSKAA